ncbi:MAG: FAD-binding oxidoreductase [Gemmataceae bacterium]|nr:FAD-binding oxidoreductase [Gemmataceae bacterium]
MAERWDALVIGGGFYGLYLAETLAARLPRVLLVERGPELMARASYANQARVHAGYHYPRSVLTAARSRANFPRFVDEFRPAVRSDFIKLYAVARRDSKVTAAQFVAAMRRVGAATERATPNERRLFDLDLIEDVFRVTEFAFDSAELKRLMAERIRRAGAVIRLNTPAEQVEPLPGGSIHVRLADAEVHAGMVVSCGYANTNAVGAASGLPVIPLKHELTEMALVEVPEGFRNVGVTVMDGPFFSCMPFPPQGLRSLSHVRYTPHGHWYDGLPGEGHLPADEVVATADKRTAFPHMARDAARYMPALAGCEYRGSLWEVKTVLPRSEADDSRPILFRPDHGLPNYHVVLGGKIDNVYDVADELTNHLGWAAPARVAA